jgi:hypothetical protein
VVWSGASEPPSASYQQKRLSRRLRMLFEFERISKGKERAYLYGDTEEEALAHLHFNDIVEHEDFEWTEWTCVDISEED